jgi:signal peptidase II
MQIPENAPPASSPSTPSTVAPELETAEPVAGSGEPPVDASLEPAGPPHGEPPLLLDVPAAEASRVPGPVGGYRPSYVFLAVVSIISFVADIGTKIWAEKRLADYPGYIDVLPSHLAFVLAKNKGGAWGLLQGTSEHVRRPFFLLVSAGAIVFIVTLYRRLQPRQYALQWGLPLVLGGALGNVFDRIRYGHVIDFIDYRAEWVRAMNDLFVKAKIAQMSTDHWPTFNIADVAICVGVGLMAVDMFTTKKVRTGTTLPPPALLAEPVEPFVAPPAPFAPAAPLDGGTEGTAAGAGTEATDVDGQPIERGVAAEHPEPPARREPHE